MALRHLVGLDIGSRYVKAVQITDNNSKLSVTNYGVAEIIAPRTAADAVLEIFDSRKFKTKRVVASVSGRSVYVRYVLMPQMNEEELVNAAKYEMGKYIPVEVDEVIHDVQKLGNLEPATPQADAEMRVLLVAARRSFVDEQVAAIESAGLTPVILDVDAFALGNAYELGAYVNPQSIVPGRLIALADIGASKTSVHIMDETGPYFTREIYKGGDDFTGAIAARTGLESHDAEALKRDVSARGGDGGGGGGESGGPEAIVVLEEEDAKKMQPEEDVEMSGAPIVVVENEERARLGDDSGDAPRMVESIAGVLDDLCHDIQISIDYFENQHDKKVHEVLLTGGGSNMTGLTESLEHLLQRPCRVWDPVQHIPMEMDEAAMQMMKNSAPQTAIALGLASRIRKD
ncbi:MAG TPA: type IV pilus assembly protein PilM [Planctomycetota bacterium]|nr:type IV pilus assembly protein PilM [Planctomycetota bacterium]